MDKNRVLQCSVVEEPDMVNENHLEEGEGRGDKMKMPQTVERTARQAGSSFGSTPLRAFSRIARSFAHSLTERPRPRAGIRAMH